MSCSSSQALWKLTYSDRGSVFPYAVLSSTSLTEYLPLVSLPSAGTFPYHSRSGSLFRLYRSRLAGLVHVVFSDWDHLRDRPVTQRHRNRSSKLRPMCCPATKGWVLCVEQEARERKLAIGGCDRGVSPKQPNGVGSLAFSSHVYIHTSPLT